MPSSKTAADERTGGVTFSPARPKLQRSSVPMDLKIHQGENEVWEAARLGAPGLGG